jgi:hypothetical protein
MNLDGSFPDSRPLDHFRGGGAVNARRSPSSLSPAEVRAPMFPYTRLPVGEGAILQLGFQTVEERLQSHAENLRRPCRDPAMGDGEQGSPLGRAQLPANHALFSLRKTRSRHDIPLAFVPMGGVPREHVPRRVNAIAPRGQLDASAFSPLDLDFGQESLTDLVGIRDGPPDNAGRRMEQPSHDECRECSRIRGVLGTRAREVGSGRHGCLTARSRPG